MPISKKLKVKKKKKIARFYSVSVLDVKSNILENLSLE